MTTLSSWIGVAIAATLFFIMQAAYWYLRERRRRIAARVREQMGGDIDPNDEAAGIRIRGLRQGQEGDAASLRNRLGDVLIQGGFELSPDRFLIGSLAAAFGTFVITALVTDSMVSGLGMAVLVGFSAYVFVLRRRDARLHAIDEQLPRALEMMVFGMRAGHALEDAIRLAADETGVPLSRELQRCYEEYKLGRPIESALEQMRQRWKTVRALGSFVEAIVVLKKTGGNLIEVMETLVDTIRAQSAYEARHRALTSEGRFSALVLMGLPLASVLMQALVSPDNLVAMVHSNEGQILLALGLVMWVLGALWAFSLVRPGRING